MSGSKSPSQQVKALEAMPDIELLALRSGPSAKDALTVLWRRHFDRVMSATMARDSDRDRERALDAVTDAFMSALTSFPAEPREPGLTFGQWWSRRAQWALMDRWKSSRTREDLLAELPDDALVAQTDQDRVDLVVDLGQVLARVRLHEKDMELLHLLLLGRSYYEIAEEMSISAVAVRTRISRLRMKIRDSLDR